MRDQKKLAIIALEFEFWRRPENDIINIDHLQKICTPLQSIYRQALGEIGSYAVGGVYFETRQPYAKRFFLDPATQRVTLIASDFPLFDIIPHPQVAVPGLAIRVHDFSDESGEEEEGVRQMPELMRSRWL
jgi:hypothetical protein